MFARPPVRVLGDAHHRRVGAVFGIVRVPRPVVQHVGDYICDQLVERVTYPPQSWDAAEGSPDLTRILLGLQETGRLVAVITDATAALDSSDAVQLCW